MALLCHVMNSVEIPHPRTKGRLGTSIRGGDGKVPASPEDAAQGSCQFRECGECEWEAGAYPHRPVLSCLGDLGLPTAAQASKPLWK